MIFELPLRLVSIANKREHWAVRARRAKQHRTAALVIPKHPVELPAVVTITRIAPRQLDSDNNVSACKAIRDGIADRFGMPDNSPLIEWRYAQEKGRAGQYAVRVELEAA